MKRVVSLGETVRLGFEPKSEAEASEQVDSDEYERKQSHKSDSVFFGTRNRNRTCNYPLGGGYYIHLTMQAY